MNLGEIGGLNPPTPVDPPLPGGDAGGVVHGGRDRGDGEQALHAAALVLPDHGHELERDLGVGIHVERDDAVAKFRRDGYRVCARQIDAPWRYCSIVLIEGSGAEQQACELPEKTIILCSSRDSISRVKYTVVIEKIMSLCWFL